MTQVLLPVADGPDGTSGSTDDLATLRLELALTRERLRETRADLERQECFLAAMLDAVDVGVITCGPDGGGWTRNRAAASMLGLDLETGRRLLPSEAAQHTDVLTSSGEPLAPDRYPLTRAVRGEDVGRVELLLGPVEGRYREVSSDNRRIHGPDGELLGAVTVMTDVTAERTALRALAEQHRQLSEAQRIGRMGSFEHDFASPHWHFSDELRSLWGLPPHGAPRTGRLPFLVDLVHPDDCEETVRQWADALAAPGHHELEFRIHRADDGVERRIRCSVEVQLGHDGRTSHVRGTTLDVTELRAAEQAAVEARTFLEAVLTASPDLTFVTDLTTGAVLFGSHQEDLLGYSAADLEAFGPRAADKILHPDDVAELRALNVAARDLEDGAVLSMRYRARHRDGRWLWLRRRVTPFHRDEQGRVVQVVGVARDVTEAVVAEDRLRHASTHDALTGLPTRVLFLQRLGEALHRSSMTGRQVTVLFCDLDGFKQVNDTAGHAAGDAVLRETGRRLTATLREGDVAARVGGDEFVVLLEPHGHPDDHPGGQRAAASAAAHLDTAAASAVVARVLEAVRAPVVHDGVPHVVTASIGMSSAGGTAELPDPESVLQTADHLMYRAKARGRDRVELAG